MAKILKNLLCLCVMLMISCTSIFPAYADNSSSANTVPANFVDEGNIALEEILEYYPSSASQGLTAQRRSTVNQKKIEVVFVVDATGSMSGAISGVKTNIAEFAQCFSGDQYNLRLGLVEFKDTAVDGMDSTIIHKVSYTPWLSTPSFISELTTVRVEGGGDTDETPIDAMGYLTGSGFNWSSDAYKFAILVTDAGYKVTNRHGIGSLNQLGQMLADRDIHTSVITSSSYYDDYGEFAAMTGGLVDDIYGDFSTMLIDYAYSIMNEIVSTASYSMRVLDSTTDLPISGAKITGPDGINFVTNDKGIATMELKSNQLDNLVLSKDGYVTAYNVGCNLMQDAIVDVYMDLVSDEDGTILISADDFENMSAGNGNISGPQMEILGKKFSLIDVPLKLDLWFFNKARMQVVYDKEAKEAKVVFGPFKKYGSDVPNNVTQTYNMMKNVAFTASQKQFQNTWKQLTAASNLKNEGQKFGFLGEGYLLSYGTFSWASGNLELKESGVTAALRTGNLVPATLREWRLPPAPWAFVKFGVLAEGVGTVKLAANAAGKMALSSGSLRIAGRPDFSINAGASKAYVGIGIYGDIGGQFNFPFKSMRESFTVDMKADGYLEIRFFGFRARPSLPLTINGKNTIQLYPEIKALAKASADPAPDYSSFSVIPRTSGTLTMAVRSSLPDHVYKDEYVYADSRPTLVELSDGRSILFWLQDDGDRKSINKSALSYSIYDGSKWSKPAFIDDDGTADYIYTVQRDGDNVHVLWQDATKAFSNRDELEDVIKNVGLSYAKFDGSKFTTAKDAGSTGKALQMPVLAVKGDDVVAIWAENNDNDPLMVTGTNTIYYAALTESGWNAPTALVSDTGRLDDMIAAVEGSNVYVVYTEAADTAANLMVSTNFGTPKQLYNAELIAYPQYAAGRLFWSNGADLLSSDDFSTVETEITALRGNGFHVVENSTEAAILFEESSNYATNVGVYYADGDSWHTPVMLTDENGRHETISAIMNEEREIMMAYQYSVISTSDKDPVQSTHMLVSKYKPARKLVADENLYYNVFAVEPNADLDLTMTVRNEGTAPSGAFLVVLMDETNTVLATKQITDSMDIGEERDIVFTYHLPAAIQSKTLTAELRSSTGAVLPGDHVRATADLGHGDLAVTDVVVTRTEEGADVTATIKNVGGRTVSGNKAIVKVGGSSGVVVSNQQMKKLAPGEEAAIQASIPASQLFARNQYDYKIIRVEAETQSAEMLFYNNAEEALLAPIPVESVALNKQTLEMSVGQTASLKATCEPSTAANKSVVWHCDNLDVLDVDPATGKITARREGSAVVTAVSEHGNLSAQCRVLVGSGSLSVKGVSITSDADTTTIGLNGSVTLTAIVMPDSALNKTVQWFCDNENCTISVTEDGKLIVTGVQPGTSTITVVTADGGYTSSMTVTVTTDVVIPDTGDHSNLVLWSALLMVSAACLFLILRKKRA